MPIRRWLTDAARLSRKFRKLTPVEHVLKRPEVYLGPMEAVERVMWLPAVKGLMTPRKVTVVPALNKLFDEILVNAADNSQRKDGTTRIDVHLGTGSKIVVENNGTSPPVVVHQTEKVYIPEMIFGTLMTGSNFDDLQDQSRTTGGRHGFGAKLTNIMSREFSVTVDDSQRNKSYKQTWTNNMRDASSAVVSDLGPVSDSKTRVEFEIDIEKFGMKKVSKDDLLFMKRRVWDLAATLNDVDVFLDNKKVPVGSFTKYVEKHRFSPSDVDGLAATVSLRGDIQLGLRILSEEERLTGVPTSVSYVNNVFTSRGGTHVVAFADQVARFVAKEIGRVDSKRTPPALNLIKNRMLTFISVDINRPQFESQSKELLTNPVTELPRKLQIIPKDVLTELVGRSGLVPVIEETMRQRNEARFRRAIVPSIRTKTKKLNIPKLEDAILAGTKDGFKCTLLLTEGDSAKALAMAGLSVVGRETYGVFPLRGKLLNVRDCSEKQLLGNQEFLSLLAIIGLKPTEDYSNPKKRKNLRYGRVMLMTDQDHDGSHIKGLAINIFDHLWPSLLQTENFLQSFITPIVKVFSLNDSKRKPSSFFTLSDFESWVAKQDPTTKFRSKYYKGLGTSTSQEAREYFSQLDTHVVPFKWDGQPDSDAIDLAFRKSRAEDRRAWLSNISVTQESSGDSFGVAARSGLSYSDFVNKELILFSQYDNHRSIPSVIDGLKPSQRKVLYACFLKNLLTAEMKVAQLAGYVAEKTAYHHGEVSLHSTIVKMAQDFVGSNNIPLLEPIGQFGTRLQGGQDSASARYIFTKVKTITRHLFPESDDPVLHYEQDDGDRIEPRHYVPIIPMILINGASGIGTGWRSEVPSYSPIDVIDNLQRLVLAEKLVPMTPWTKGFKGSYSRISPGEFACEGRIEVTSDESVRITELPVGVWTENYRTFLMNMTGSQIRDYKELHTEASVDFEVFLDPKLLVELQMAEGLIRFFRLESKVRLKQMFLFDKKAKIRQFESPEEILEYFAPIRIGVYSDRKDFMLRKLSLDIYNLRSRERFLDLVTSESLSVAGRPVGSVMSDMIRLGFEEFERTSQAASRDTRKPFDYLLRTPLQELTRESLEKLGEKAARKEAARSDLEVLSPERMWLDDLKALREILLQVPEFCTKGEQKSSVE